MQDRYVTRGTMPTAFLAVALAVLCAATGAAETNGVDVISWDIALRKPVVATNPVIEVTWHNAGTNDVSWRGAVTNTSGTWAYRFFDLYIANAKCSLRDPETDLLHLVPNGRTLIVSPGESVRFRMEVARRWILPEDWEMLTFRYSGRGMAMAPFGTKGYCRIVNLKEVFTFDREGNRVQNTDPDP